eukprot:scaffold1314_cov158-Amphora_coffeaeformis.AAC.11
MTHIRSDGRQSVRGRTKEDVNQQHNGQIVDMIDRSMKVPNTYYSSAETCVRQRGNNCEAEYGMVDSQGTRKKMKMWGYCIWRTSENDRL